MLIYLMALDTEEERIKFIKLYEEYRNRMHYSATFLTKNKGAIFTDKGVYEITF